MKRCLIYPIGTTSAVKYAAEFLSKAGLELLDHPAPEVTHLLLDVPSFGNDGKLRGGGSLEKILETLPQYITVIGGKLEHSALEEYKTVDLLQNEEYLARNAAITADCAVQVAAPLLKTTFAHSPALIIGWGRIGKCLGQLLRNMGCPVTIAARKDKDRAMLAALGHETADPARLQDLGHYRLIFNTAPETVLSTRQMEQCKNCVKIDLASRRGLPGTDVLWARGLPGIYAPESSGRLIADTLLSIIKEEKA